MKRLEKDLYGIELDSQGKKQVHIYGYAYNSEDRSAEPYRFVEFTFLIIPIEEFVTMTTDDILRAENQSKQYIGDYSEADIRKTVENYFGEPMTELSFDDVTIDTPCGCYIVP